MKFKLGDLETSMETIIDLFEKAVGTTNLTKTESKDLAVILKKLWEDNKMIYGSEGDYVRL